MLFISKKWTETLCCRNTTQGHTYMNTHTHIYTHHSYTGSQLRFTDLHFNCSAHLLISPATP